MNLLMTALALMGVGRDFGLATCIIGFRNLGTRAGLYTYTPELYPTRIRGAGSGVAASVRRIAGFI